MCNTTILPVFFFFFYFCHCQTGFFCVICCIFTSAIQIANAILVISSQVNAELCVPIARLTKDTKIASAYFFSHFSLFTFYAERWDEVIIALHELRTSI